MGERVRLAHTKQIKAITEDDFVSESVDNLRFRRRLSPNPLPLYPISHSLRPGS